MARNSFMAIDPSSSEEQRLVSEYHIATERYTAAVGELAQQRPTMTPEDYTKLLKRVLTVKPQRGTALEILRLNRRRNCFGLSRHSQSISDRAPQSLIDGRRSLTFSNAELGIGPTFVRAALLSLDAGNIEHYAQAKQHAIEAAGSVRRFMDRVANIEIRTEIGKRADDLDRLIRDALN